MSRPFLMRQRVTSALRGAGRPPVSLYWWRWQHPYRLNFGDEITAPIIERATGRDVRWAPLDNCDLVGAGSILQRVVRAAPSPEPPIWGSGLIAAGRKVPAAISANVLAVRGRLTLSRLSDIEPSNVALGDPGLLAPILIDKPVSKQYSIGIVAHYRDERDAFVDRVASLDAHTRVINVAWTPEEVTRTIAACDIVISSSLHGLIVADSFRIPNIHVLLGDGLVGGLYKFRDYNSVFSPERHHAHIPSSLPTGSANDLIAFVRSIYEPPHALSTIQARLLAALPR